MHSPSVSGPNREGMTIKKPPFPREKRRFNRLAKRTPACIKKAVEPHLCSSSREHKGSHFFTLSGVEGCKMGSLTIYSQLQAGFLTCVLPQSSFPSGSSFTGQWIGFPFCDIFAKWVPINASRISPALILTNGNQIKPNAADKSPIPNIFAGLWPQ